MGTIESAASEWACIIIHDRGMDEYTEELLREECAIRYKAGPEFKAHDLTEKIYAYVTAMMK